MARVDVWDGLPDGTQGSADRAAWVAARPLRAGTIMGALRERFYAGWAHERLGTQPREFPSDNRQPGVKMSRYKWWMGLDCSEGAAPEAPSHAKAYIPVRQHKNLMRFRMGSWPLAVNVDCSLAREQRVCTRCAAGCVEDERHVLLECPAYTAERSGLGDLGPNSDMCAVMRDTDPGALAEALARIWERRFGELP